MNLSETLIALGDACRERFNTTDKLTLSDMVKLIKLPKYQFKDGTVICSKPINFNFNFDWPGFEGKFTVDIAKATGGTITNPVYFVCSGTSLGTDHSCRLMLNHRATKILVEESTDTLRKFLIPKGTKITSNDFYITEDSAGGMLQKITILNKVGGVIKALLGAIHYLFNVGRCAA